MKEIVITFLALIFFGNLGFSKVGSVRDTLETTTVLYKVTHPDIQYESYLFGTHHAFGKPFFDSLQFAKDALLSCKILIKENLNIPGHLAEDIINKRTSTTKWNKYLDKENYSYIQALFSPSNLEFDKMTPAELYAFLSRHYKEKVCIGKDPKANYFSLDDYIGMIAEQNQIEVIGLETTEDQISLINNDLKGMPRKVHKRRLESMINRIQSESDDHCAETEWYREMDFDFRLNESCQNTLVLSDRNEKWMIQIQDHFTSKSCFVAVGLSHLMFECGLISKLSELGYKIDPIEVK
ncbi:TraB/GumN family protein [Lewinella cohaerens]|uniref:TraB/GumN family protein n=1 Tax=Lewinella cohaerens TaxID=70995 RepID=UPI000364C0EE|nr:TraB/GumN family protein [Lewinella cohaerens]